MTGVSKMFEEYIAG